MTRDPPELLTSTDEGAAVFIDCDFREPEAVLEQAADTLDLSRPVAVTLVAILHLIDDDNDPHGLVGPTRPPRAGSSPTTPPSPASPDARPLRS